MGRPAWGRASGRSPRRPRRRRRSRWSAGTGRRGGSRSGTATPRRCGPARSAGRWPPSAAGRRPRSARRPRSGTRRRARWSIDALEPGWSAAVPGSAAADARRRAGSPPVDAALERLLHLVEVGRERAGRQVLPAAVGQQRDDRARRSSASPRARRDQHGPARRPGEDALAEDQVAQRRDARRGSRRGTSRRAASGRGSPG